MNTTDVANKMNGKQSFKDLKDGAHDMTSTFTDKVGEASDAVSSRIMDTTADVRERASEYTKSATKYAKENPLTVALGAVAVGVLAGMLLARRK